MDEWFVPKFSQEARSACMALKSFQKLQIGTISCLKDKEPLLGMLSSIEYALSLTLEELEMIRNQVERPHSIPHEYSLKVWKGILFCIPMKVIPIQTAMIEERVW